MRVPTGSGSGHDDRGPAGTPPALTTASADPAGGWLARLAEELVRDHVTALRVGVAGVDGQR